MMNDVFVLSEFNYKKKDIKKYKSFKKIEHLVKVACANVFPKKSKTIKWHYFLQDNKKEMFTTTKKKKKTKANSVFLK